MRLLPFSRVRRHRCLVAPGCLSYPAYFRTRAYPMLYAAYGSNLHPARLAERLPSARLLGTGHLQHWSLRFYKRSKDDSGKCSILSGSEGVFFAISEISARDKLALDRIEGLGDGYAEVSLHIPPFGDCASYVAQESHVDYALRPYDWYQALVLAGARFHGFPDDYVARIGSVPAMPDPDAERSARHWALARRMASGS